MHKAVQLTVLLALLFCVVHSQSQAMNQTNQTMNQSNQTMNQSMNQSIDLIPGLPFWSPRAPHNDPSCFIMIMAQIMPNGTGVWLNQTYNSSVNVSNSSQSNPHCSFYNFKFKSFFFNEFLNVSLDSWYWTMNSSSMANSTAGFANNSSNMTAMNISNSTMNASNNSSWNASAVMNASDLIMLNGTACLLLPQNEWFGVEQYICKMEYDSIHVYLLVWGNWVNGTWKWNINNGTQAWWAWSMNTNRQAMNGTNWLSNDQNWGVVVGSLWDSCGSDTNVSSLSSNVTIYTEVNLAYWVPQVWLAYTVIKQWTPNTMHNWNSMNATGWNASYLVWAANMSNNSYNMPFNNSNSSIDGCWSLNMTYGDILPNMSYCEHGCEVTFIFADEMGRIYPIQTTGLWTPNMTMNGTSANGTNTSVATDGNGRRLDVTVGADSSGAGVTVSSGLALGMNIMLLVLSLIYVN